MVLPREDLKEILEIEDEFDILVAQVKDIDEIEKIKEDISNALRKNRNLEVGEEDFAIQTPQEALGGIKDILNIVKLIVGAIAAISLLVGGLGIASTMFTSVVERTKEIGIMKSIGARNEDILYLFLIEAGLLGVVGGIFGALIGMSLAFLVEYGFGIYIPGIPFDVKISYNLLLGAVGFSFLVGAVSGIIPARQAARLKPVEALRK
jgi:putative ABC transport system permease protein